MPRIMMHMMLSTRNELTIWNVFLLTLLTSAQVSQEENPGAGGSSLSEGTAAASRVEDGMILAASLDTPQDRLQPSTNDKVKGDGGQVEPPIVETRQGRVRGRRFPIRNNEFVAGFLGIPYAEPPLQELRFRPPMRKNSWDDIFNATEFSSICIQPGEQRIWDVVQVRNRSTIRKRKLDNYNMSEDCLTLNLYVPMTANGSLPYKPVLPVFFFIHGGSYYMNAGRLYPGQVLASMQNMIVVTFNYRLGPLGFLSTGDRAAPGNYGLLDQTLALEWVHENVAQFGGDPQKITLVGNSAGGASVMFHMFSELSRGKFVGITVQSGCSGAPWAIQESPRKHAESLATKLKCPVHPTTDLVDCLRNFPPLQIMKNAKLEDGLSLAYAAVIDGLYGGNFLSATPEQLIRQNKFQHVPILTGFTRDEVTIWFTDFGPTTQTKDLVSFVQLDVVSLLEDNPTVTSANIAAMIHFVTVQYLYRSGIAENDTTGKTTSVSEFISDVGLKAPCVKEMNLLTKYNSKPVYLYEFNYYSVDDVKMGRKEWIGLSSKVHLIYQEVVGLLSVTGNRGACFLVMI
ncbi:unnamed protein product [Allacma fusca]|uniref:Carboxylic ester hydrolase n=1 Tax=Allacma fusca TaxID=39272 RepID=A0A8J2M779_9HEXA|nr:unnamed protein product [Allacma fusca]